MKGIILAGGRGTRLLPLTRAVNKSLLPVGGEPLIWHSIRRLVEANITDITIVVGPEHSGQIMTACGDGADLGASLAYLVQPEPKGIAHGIGLARRFVGHDRCVVLLGDNVFERPLVGFVETFDEQAPNTARVALRLVSDPERFGVAEFTNPEAEWPARKIGRIVEKPVVPPSQYAVVGLYAYTPTAFDVIANLIPSNRNELEVTDLNNYYAARQSLDFSTLGGAWIDAGTPASLREADTLAWSIRR